MASSPLDVIKQYLVSLGFEVDKSSYDSATKAIDSAGESLSKLAGTTVKQFGLATVAVASFVTTAVVGISKFLKDLGNAQIQYEMLSRQMWTTQQNAEAFSTTLKAMGRSLNDLYLSPTLMQQFEALNRQAFQMMPPAEYQQQMQFIQSISFEFTRMKLEGTYALQWIGYYFIKYMAGPLSNIQMTLHGINDTIIKTMPYWTKVVAEVMSWFAQFGVTTVEAIKDIAMVFNDVGASIPKNIKLIGLALLGLLLIMNQGPIGWIIDAFVALELLLNDFFTYIHGGQSEFGAFWQKLIDLYNKLKDTGAIDAFKNGFKTALKDISQFIKDVIKDIKEFYNALVQDGYFSKLENNFQTLYDIIKILVDDGISWFNSFYKALNQSDIIRSLVDDFAGLDTSILNVVSAVMGLIDQLLGLKGTNTVLKDLGDWLANYILDTLEGIDTLIQWITSEFNILADLLQGKWGDAWKNFKDLFTKDLSPLTKQSYIYPSNSNKTTNNSSSYDIKVNNNIYGSDPQATAAAANNNITTVLRNTKGVIY